MPLTRAQLDVVIRKRFPGYVLQQTLSPGLYLDYAPRRRDRVDSEDVFIHLSDDEHLTDMEDGHAPRKHCVAHIWYDPIDKVWVRRTNPGPKGAIRYGTFKTQELAVADAVRWAKRRFRYADLRFIEEN